MGCQNCPLYKTRIRQVIGRGEPEARLVFIRESPSSSEDTLGRAFVSDSSKVLMEMIARVGIPIDECYFTYMVQCRAGGRAPSAEEIMACMPNIGFELGVVQYSGAIFIGDVVEKYWKNRIKSPYVKLTDLNIIFAKGGPASNLFIDNLNKLERFYAKVQGE